MRLCRPVVIGAAGVQTPRAGSYNSALQRSPESFWPPATRTRPFVSRTAVWFTRAKAIEPVRVQLPVVGSNNSALDRMLDRELSQLEVPPATRTFPFGNNIAVWPSRGEPI